jgi:integrase
VLETDVKEARGIEIAVNNAKMAGASPAKIEQAKINARIPRLRVETIVKHTRALNRPGKMLVKLGEVAASPFVKHMISARSETAMRKQEEKRDRRPWDDRIYKLLNTCVFQGQTDGVGDPLFWAPLMALLGGARQEELLQLSPKDFEADGGIHYYRLTNGEGQSIKSESGHRLIPVHPELIRLGLLELVALRLKEGEPRLFPYLQRGKNKQTYSELFTKDFTKYRQANNVYWRGLDFHALRTTFHHALIDKLVPGYAKRRILGHRPLDEGEISYSQNGISVATLNVVIEAVAFDLSMVKSPFGKRIDRAKGSAAQSPLRLVR